MSIRLRVAAPAVAAGLILSGCGSSSDLSSAKPNPSTVTSAAATTATVGHGTAAAPTGSNILRGSKIFVDQVKGFQVAVPPGYKRITSKAQLTKVFKAGAQAGLPASIAQKGIDKNSSLLIVNPKTSNLVSVVTLPANGAAAAQLSRAAAGLKEQLSGIGATGVSTAVTTVGGNPAVRAAYALVVAGKNLSTAQYIISHNDQTYTLTLISPQSVPFEIEQQMVSSWKFL